MTDPTELKSEQELVPWVLIKNLTGQDHFHICLHQKNTSHSPAESEKLQKWVLKEISHRIYYPAESSLHNPKERKVSKKPSKPSNWLIHMLLKEDLIKWTIKLQKYLESKGSETHSKPQQKTWLANTRIPNEQKFEQVITA